MEEFDRADAFPQFRSTSMPAAIACFRNEPVLGEMVMDAEYVRAHIIYRDAAGEELEDIPCACWMAHHGDTIDLEVGKTQCCIIGLLKDTQLIVPWKKREPTEYGDFIRLTVTRVDDCDSVEIKLIGDRNQLVIEPISLKFAVENKTLSLIRQPPSH
jgi:hypothetical protein